MRTKQLIKLQKLVFVHFTRIAKNMAIVAVPETEYVTSMYPFKLVASKKSKNKKTCGYSAILIFNFTIVQFLVCNEQQFVRLFEVRINKNY